MRLFRLDEIEGRYQMRPATEAEVRQWGLAKVQNIEPEFDLHIGVVGYGESVTDVEYQPVELRILPVGAY